MLISSTAVLLLALAPQSVAPPKESIPQLIALLSSTDLRTRYSAFEKLDAVPHVFEREDAAEAAVMLLITEEHIWNTLGAGRSSPDWSAVAAQFDAAFPGPTGEDFGPYVGDVQAEVWHYAERTHDPVAINALFYGPEGPGSAIEAFLASQGSAILSEMEAASHSADFFVRANAINTAADMLRLDAAQPGVYIAASERGSARARAHAIIANALKDGNEEPRRQALNELYQLNGTGDRDLVRQAAANDPSPEIRDHARRLLAGYDVH